MPPLMDDPPVQPAVDDLGQKTVYADSDGVEAPTPKEVESTLAARVDAMLVEQGCDAQ
jgi:hypothetical protein